MLRPIHFEIHAADPERVKGFYEALFGWTIAQWGDMPYWTIKTGEGSPGIDGGMVKRVGSPADPSAPTPVIAYVCTVDVPDVDDYVKKAIDLGGAVAVPKMPIPGVGWLAYVKDTDANIFGLMTPDPRAA